MASLCRENVRHFLLQHSHVAESSRKPTPCLEKAPEGVARKRLKSDPELPDRRKSAARETPARRLGLVPVKQTPAAPAVPLRAAPAAQRK